MLSLLAHAGHGEHSFFAGFLHPITGLDHLMAAVAVGILTTRLAREPARASTADEGLALPAAFIGGMTLGGLLARLGIALPDVEFGIALSLIAVGLALSLRRIGPTWIAASVLASLAVFHGHAHLAEYAQTTGLAGYAIGLIAGTATLHAAGIALALSADRFKLPAMTFARAAGAVALTVGVLKITGLA